MNSKVKRHLRSAYKKGDRQLPRPLSFLANVAYVAVVERSASGRVERSVELKPSLIKRLLGAEAAAQFASEQHAASERTIVHLLAEIGGLNEKLAQASGYTERLEHNNALLLQRLDQTPDEKPTERSPKSHYNRIVETGVRPGLPGMSGGLPSLGKRK